MAFYQKFRPQKFIDIVGQDHICTALSGAIIGSRVSHAYLFTGPRGLGKTSVARILAKVLCCLDRSQDSAEPCGKCRNCTEITSGNSMDVIEIDAASNRGIDEMRELREKIKFGPSGSKYKVYIIDEVHMLTEPAFNALLKTIEEPPKHAVFILATTELHKVPLTILSRCQKFDFHRATPEIVSGKLKKIAEVEKVKISNEAIELISRLAEGSFRDGESILEQVSSVSKDKEITLEEAEQLLGISSRESRIKLLKYLVQGDAKSAIGHLEQESANGRDMKQMINDLIEMVRELLLLKVQNKKVNLEVQSLAESLSLDGIVFILEKLIEASHEQKISSLPQLPLEMVVIAYIKRFQPIDSVANDVTEKKIKEVIKEDVKEDVKEEKKPILEIKISKKAESKEDPATKVKIVGEINDEMWKKFLEELKPLNHSLYAIINEAKVLGFDDKRLRLGVKFKFHADRVNDKLLSKDLDTVSEKVFGLKVHVSAEVYKEEKKSDLPHRKEEEVLGDALEVFGADV